MSTAQNGWPASRDPLAIGVKPFVVAGRSFPGGVKGGAVSTCLKYVACQYHLRVESLYTGAIDRDDWGYNFRYIAGTNVISVHGAGGAIDVNASTNPQGVAHTFTYAQEQIIRRILREAYGSVAWGQDFSHHDAMHFQVVDYDKRALVYSAAKKLLNPPWWQRDLYVTGTDPKKWLHGYDVKTVQYRLGFPEAEQDSWFGPDTATAVKKLEARLHLPQTGKVTKGRAFYLGAYVA